MRVLFSIIMYLQLSSASNIMLACQLSICKILSYLFQQKTFICILCNVIPVVSSYIYLLISFEIIYCLTIFLFQMNLLKNLTSFEIYVSLRTLLLDTDLGFADLKADLMMSLSSSSNMFTNHFKARSLPSSNDY